MKGIIAWFARNGVAANLLMFCILLLGFRALHTSIPTEVFPDFELDIVQIGVPFRGATPAEAEEGVVIRIEEAIQDLEGIKQISSSATEGAGAVSVEIEKGYDARELLDDIKNRVDAINTFPAETEKPVVSLAQPSSAVLTVVLSAEMSEHELRVLGERVRDEISSLPDITQVALQGVRPYEISIDVPEEVLQRHGLTLATVARAISETSIDLAAGAIKTAGGEVLLRTKGQAYVRDDFERIVLITRPDGTRLTVGDVATVRDGFEETPLFARFNGKPAVLITVSRVGDQNAIELANSVKEYMAEAAERLPEGVELSFWNDRSKIVRGRLNTLLNSAVWGALLVILVLALFLRISVALWVFLGIPISFAGAIALMPYLGVTFNIFSLFAFILVLGIVVDDAIVTGENIFTHLQRNENATHAAIAGAQEVAVPVVFGILTTIIAFTPIMMIEGIRGKIFIQIPLIVIPVLLFSLVESKLILPAHLKHVKPGKPDRATLNPVVRFQRVFADGLESFVHRVYRPILASALRHRYLTLALFLGGAIILFGIVRGGRVLFVFFPRVDSETATARLVMGEGTPVEVTAAHIDKMAAAARELRDKYTDEATGESVVVNILAVVGGQGLSGGGGPRGGQSLSGRSNLGEVSFRVVPPEERKSISIRSPEIVREWRQMIGGIPGAQELTFRAEIGRGGDPIDIQLSGPDFDDLQAAAEEVKATLARFPGVFDISDTFEDGKQEIQLQIKPEAEILGLTMTDLARQTRQAFFGLEAQRIQRGRDDVRVMVRYPESERRSLANLENMRIRTAAGAEVPFSAVAEAEMGRSFSTIRRIDRNRTINVRADANKEEVDLTALIAEMSEVLPGIVGQYPAMRYTLEGEAREQEESFGSLALGSLFILFAIYSLLAIPFGSYVQPLIVMSVIPFGLVGAVLGHMIMGMHLSIMSLFGMLALSGVVVNDSLVLVDYINRRRREGLPIIEAVRIAGAARFRAILLTSITTFVGLMPLMFEKSTQAQFLIPMGVSLGFGVLFATGITLLLVPINYTVLEDLRRTMKRYWDWQLGRQTDQSAPKSEAENPEPADQRPEIA